MHDIIGPICRYVPFHTERSRISFFVPTRLRDWKSLSYCWKFRQTFLRKILEKILRLKRRVLGKNRTTGPSRQNFTKRVFYLCTSRPRLVHLYMGIKKIRAAADFKSSNGLLRLAGLNQPVLAIQLELWPDGTLSWNFPCTPPQTCDPLGLYNIQMITA